MKCWVSAACHWVPSLFFWYLKWIISSYSHVTTFILCNPRCPFWQGVILRKQCFIIRSTHLPHVRKSWPCESSSPRQCPAFNPIPDIKHSESFSICPPTGRTLGFVSAKEGDISRKVYTCFTALVFILSVVFFRSWCWYAPISHLCNYYF